MRDIKFNLQYNDIEIINGDFAIANPVGQQNTALMTDKSVVNIMRPEWGLGYTEFYYNYSSSLLPNVLSELVRMLYDDGATSAYANYVGKDNKGNNVININSSYGE